MVLNRELTFVLSYLCKLAVDLRSRLRRMIERDLSYWKLKIVFSLSVDLTHSFDLKIHWRKKLESLYVY